MVWGFFCLLIMTASRVCEMLCSHHAWRGLRISSGVDPFGVSGLFRLASHQSFRAQGEVIFGVYWDNGKENGF